MTETYQQQSALAHLHLAARQQAGAASAGVILSERAFRGQVNLRGDAGDDAFTSAIAEVASVTLPLEPNTFTQAGGRTALWLGPDEWLLVLADADEAGAAAALRQALTGQHASVVETGHSRTVIGVSGPHARDVLMKGCSLDLHPRSFGPRHCAQTPLARNDMILAQITDAPAYEVNVRRSFAHYTWVWLEDAAREYGLTISQD